MHEYDRVKRIWSAQTKLADCSHLKKNLASVLEIWMIIHIIQNGIKNFFGRFLGDFIGNLEGNYFWDYFLVHFGHILCTLWRNAVDRLKMYQLIPRTTDAQWAGDCTKWKRTKRGPAVHSCDNLISILEWSLHHSAASSPFKSFHESLWVSAIFHGWQ